MSVSLLANRGLIAALVLLLVLACSAPAPPAAPAADVGEQRGGLFSDFLALKDGPAPTRFTSGQPASLAPTPPEWEKLTIANGRLTLITNSAERRAGYFRTPDMGRPIRRIGMQWTVDGKPGGGPGVAAIGVTGSPVDPLRSTSAPMAVHLLVERDGWNFSVSPGPLAGDPRLIELARGDFTPPLVEDGTTVYQADVSITGPDATVALPNGVTANVSDPRIAAWAGRFGFFEAYADAGVLDGVVGITKLWANS